MVQGASRGLGLEVTAQLLARPGTTVVATSRRPDASEGLKQLKERYNDRLFTHQMDVTDLEAIKDCAAAIKSRISHLNLLFNVTGVLHIPGVMRPETGLARINYEDMLLTFQTNAFGPVMVTQQFSELLAAAKGHGASDSRPAVLANMSARVGSIGDNALGGWYSYRASKAALNQLTRCMSLEFKRRKQKVACVLLHPGTCDTDLSAPFQTNVPEGKLFTRERGARQLLTIIDSVDMGTSGSFIAWDGQSIPW